MYRLFFLTIEPIFALGGALLSYFGPLRYLQLTHPASAPSAVANIPLSTQIVLAQLANLYLLFAINEALVLRSTSELKVWRTVLVGLLIADFGHLYSVSLLGLDVYWKVNQWNIMDFGNVGFVYGGAAMRIAFLAGVGLQAKGAKRSRRRDIKSK